MFVLKIGKKSKSLTNILIYKKLNNSGKFIEILKNVIVCQSLVLTVVLDSFQKHLGGSMRTRAWLMVAALSSTLVYAISLIAF